MQSKMVDLELEAQKSGLKHHAPKTDGMRVVRWRQENLLIGEGEQNALVKTNESLFPFRA